jgi:hypothetical protein
VILVIGVPVLAIGLWAARRGSLRGRIVWLGALAFMAYVWASSAGTTSFNQFFLGYVALFSLSIFTLVSAVASTDATTVRQQLEGQLATTVYAGFLALVGIGLGLLWLAEIVPASIAGTVPRIVEEVGETGTHTFVLDLGIVVPALLLTAVWLHQDRAAGYLFAGALLVMAALLAPLLTGITVADFLGDVVTLSLSLIIGTVLPPAVAIVFAVAYLRWLDSGPPATREGSR